MSVIGALNSRLHAECKGSGMPQETPSAHQPEKPTASLRILAPLLGAWLMTRMSSSAAVGWRPLVGVLLRQLTQNILGM